jgi:hypothetical protein
MAHGLFASMAEQPLHRTRAARLDQVPWGTLVQPGTLAAVANGEYAQTGRVTSGTSLQVQSAAFSNP